VAISVAITIATALLIWLFAGSSIVSLGTGIAGCGMMEYGLDIASPTAVLNIINIVLLAFLIAQYVSMYRRIGSEFTLGLIILAYVLLAHALMSSPVFLSGMGSHGFSSDPLAFIRTVFTTIAAAVLLYLNSR